MGKCPETIKRLVDRFNQQSDQIRSPDYNETLIRIDFINPLMRELGWDIDNAQGFAEQYREVVHEDRVKVAGQTKAPDYSFRVGGSRKFFLEAKKPSVDIKNSWEPAYQLRRYAWSAKLACSLLTDFEEFAIYDTRIRPREMEKASVARREFIRYTEYDDRWDFLHGTFSKQAVLTGEFDRYCESKKGRGAELFDDAFLAEIEEWRKNIATSLARHNEALDESALNFAVQRIIDRIIFLRIAEDRGTETTGQLRALLNGDEVYPRLCKLFRDADARYNSGLFHFAREKDRDESPDTLTPTLDVDDRTLKGIIKALYYPASPYEFTMVSADILGSVYERFLGKIITLTAGHNAKIEEKPEVRKAGGVYYTPTYIVDYIVQNTVGKLLGEGGEGLGFGVWGLGNAQSQPSGLQTPDPKPQTPTLHGDSHAAQHLSTTGRLGGLNATGGTRLRSGETAAGRGEVRSDQSNAPGGGLSSRKHRRGIREDTQGGLSSSPVDRPRLTGGSGDTADTLRAPEDDRPRRDVDNLEPNPVDRQTPRRSSAIPQTISKPQTQSPRPRLKILDPACGSGSFLIGTYQFLLDWYLDFYTATDPMKYATGKNPVLRPAASEGLGFRGAGSGVRGLGSGDKESVEEASRSSQTLNPNPRTLHPETPASPPQTRQSFRLTIAERKRILLDHIHGVDLDGQAVEVTKLNLLLKCLEGETSQTLGFEQRLFRQRALPDLGKNILCGNSLIGTDIIGSEAWQKMSEEERRRINPFDYERAFPQVFKGKDGGFDAVIGNPPYGFHEIHLDAVKSYLKNRYSVAEGSFENYFLFYEASLRLVAKGGHHGFIVPVTWLTIPSAKALRRYLLGGFAINRIVWLPELVFKNAQVNTLVSLMSRVTPSSTQIEIHDALGFVTPAIQTRTYKQDSFIKDGFTLNIFVDPDEEKLLERIRKISVPLSEFAHPCSGYNPYEVGAGIAPDGKLQTKNTVEEKPYHSSTQINHLWKPEVVGRDLGRYALRQSGERWVKYGPWLAAARDPTNFLGKRILVQEVVGGAARRVTATYCDEPLYHSRDVIAVKTDLSFPTPQYLLAILNSRLLSWYHHKQNPKAKKGLFPKVLVSDLAKMPVVNPSTAPTKKLHDQLTSLVDSMLSLHKRLSVERLPQRREQMQREIDATDRQIDQLVYQLYGLSDEEIRIVEEATG